MVNMNQPKADKILTEADYSGGTKQVLEESQKIVAPYTTTVLGKEFVVLPNVFSPKYFNDTEIFAEHLPIRKGDRIFEAGPGTAAVSILAILKGAESAVGTDINPDAVKNSRVNVEKFGLQDKIDIREGDVYSALQPGEKFDVIFWNVPFELSERKDISNLEKAVIDPGYVSITKFINGAAEHLTEKGRLYIGFSSTLGDYKLLEKIAKSAGYDLLTIYSEKSTEVHPVKFEIIEAIKRR